MSESVNFSLRNKVIARGAQLIAMQVTGPNCRSDFHVNPTEELFIQVKGDIEIQIVDFEPDVKGIIGGSERMIVLKEGECCVVHAYCAHCVKRPVGTVGIVVEMEREIGQLDNFVWIGAGGEVMRRICFFVGDLDKLEEKMKEEIEKCEDEKYSKNER